MKNKPFEMCMLFDFYGEILTDKQKDAFDLYYNEDLSLSEISVHLSITMQAVRDAVLRSENILRDMENKLGLIAKYGNISEEMQKINLNAKQLSMINAEKYRNDKMQYLILGILDTSKKLSTF